MVERSSRTSDLLALAFHHDESWCCLNSMSKQGWINGVLRAAPIVLGYIPVAIAYGVLAQKSGLSALNTMLMSLLVYAGSAQLIAVSLFGANAPVLSVIMTTFVVNLRHLIMASAVAPFLKRWRKVELAAFAYQLTDETFAVHSTNFPSGTPDKAEVFATNITAQTAWVTGTVIGIVAGQLITDVKPFALDYALPAMFAALLVLQIKKRIHVVIALLTGVLAIVLLQAGMKQWNVITATVVGATVGVVIEQLLNKK
jgi:4-azaleucine resistance transporter AzlC